MTHPYRTARGDFCRKKSFIKHQSLDILSWQQHAYLPYRPTQSARLRLLTKVLSILAILGHRQGGCGRSRGASAPVGRANNRHSMGNTWWCDQPLAVNNTYGATCTTIFKNRPFMLEVTLASHSPLPHGSRRFLPQEIFHQASVTRYPILAAACVSPLSSHAIGQTEAFDKSFVNFDHFGTSPGRFQTVARSVSASGRGQQLP